MVLFWPRHRFCSGFRLKRRSNFAAALQMNVGCCWSFVVLFVELVKFRNFCGHYDSKRFWRWNVGSFVIKFVILKIFVIFLSNDNWITVSNNQRRKQTPPTQHQSNHSAQCHQKHQIYTINMPPLPVYIRLKSKLRLNLPEPSGCAVLKVCFFPLLFHYWLLQLFTRAGKARNPIVRCASGWETESHERKAAFSLSTLGENPSLCTRKKKYTGENNNKNNEKQISKWCLLRHSGRTEYYPFPFISFFTLFFPHSRFSQSLTGEQCQSSISSSWKLLFYDILCALAFNLVFLGDDKTVQPYFTVEQTPRTLPLHNLPLDFPPLFFAE